MVNRDPIVQILFEAAQRGRALRLAREAQEETPITGKLGGMTVTGAGDKSATQEARRNRREKDTTP